MDLNIWLPVKNPGDYYVRAAIRDKASGKIGSGYQFLEIPDLSGSRLSLSSIFILNQAEDAAAIKSGKMDESGNSPDSVRNWQAINRSPALRSYLPGEGFDYMTVIYNARTKQDQPPKLEVMYRIFKDGKEYLKGNAEDIDLSGVDDLGRIPITKRLTFDNKMPEGTYLFQLVVTDKQNKSRTAAQALDFGIRNPD